MQDMMSSVVLLAGYRLAAQILPHTNPDIVHCSSVFKDGDPVSTNQSKVVEESQVAIYNSETYNTKVPFYQVATCTYI